MECLAKCLAVSECSENISDGHYPIIFASTVSSHSHDTPATPHFIHNKTGGSKRMNDLSKVGHQESGQGLHQGLLTPVLVIFPLNPKVIEDKGFGASMGTLMGSGGWARACQGSGQGDRTLLKARLVLTGALHFSVHPGRGVAAVCVLVVAIHNGVGWAAAICGVGRRSRTLEKCRQTPGARAGEDPGYHCPLRGESGPLCSPLYATLLARVWPPQCVSSTAALHMPSVLLHQELSW